MSRPRIVFCYRYGVLGGVSTQLLNRYPHLSDEYDVTVLYEADHGMAGNFPPGVVRMTPSADDRVQAIRELRPDIVVVIDSPRFIAAWQEAGEPGRLVLEVHTTTPNLAYLRDQGQFNGLTHIVTVSEYMERMLRDQGLGDVAPISIVPNCLDDDWRADANPPQLNEAPIAWVGKLDGHKRWRTATDIMDTVCQSVGLDVVPLIIGGYTAPAHQVQALTTKLATFPSLSRGQWWPRLEYRNMPAVYSTIGFNGGVLLSTTTNESFGMSVAEALIRGCPVIAPAVGALPEILPAEAMYAQGDWDAAAALTRQALLDSDFRTRLLSTVPQVAELTRPVNALAAYQKMINATLEKI
ncbi:hypothetical protein GCM10009555_040310 [Acrocarpospora macrocephala]|uniref:Glycosyl transferase family 1 domain-containing protein n=1 Tax=Acrocarpospora macrocephala TaxID=150177 RepID=A0A5M3WMX5_9ACTN|nr:glycosyltransferase family 4 protein [Acrocarpospora macrocephala]GES09996.1 hypothetical protein Amac_035920 [Acrocarpospora macrocephala]